MLMSSFIAARLVFLPDKNMWKKKWNYIHVFLCCSFLESMSNLLQLLAHQPKPTNDWHLPKAGQSLRRSQGPRRRAWVGSSFGVGLRSLGELLHGKKTQQGRHGPRLPPPERLDGKHHGTMSMSTMLIMSPLSLMYFEACVYCCFKMSLKFCYLQSITPCTRKIILTAPVQSSHLHISTCHFLASCVTRKLKDTKNMSHLDWNPRSFAFTW